jgi:hypothetical protein
VAGGHVGVRDLAAGMHSGVSPARHGQLNRLRRPQHPAESFLDDLLDSSQTRLASPAGKIAAVVGEVDPQPTDGIGRPVSQLHSGRLSQRAAGLFSQRAISQLGRRTGG